MQLDRSHLEHAIRLCNQEIKAIQLTDPHAPDYEQVLDGVVSAITLRKVHKLRLDEAGRRGAAPLLASQQYERNKLAA